MAQLQTLGVEVFYASAEYRTLLVRAVLTEAETIAALPDVIHVQPKPEMTTHAFAVAVPVDAAAPRSPSPRRAGVRSSFDREKLIRSIREALAQGPVRMTAVSAAAVGMTGFIVDYGL